MQTPPRSFSVRAWPFVDSLGVAAVLAAITFVAPSAFAQATPQNPAALPPLKGQPQAHPIQKALEGLLGQVPREVTPAERAARGVVVIERNGTPLGLGAVLGGDGRIISALSPLGAANDLDARFADGSVAKLKLGHQDRGWDLALLVPQTGKWAEGLVASPREPVRPDANMHAFTLNRGKVVPEQMLLRSHRSLIGADDRSLDSAIELGSRVNPLDLGAPVVDEDGRVVAMLGRGCAPNDKGACTPVAFGAPMQAIKAFLRSVPATAVQPAAWLGIQGVPETMGVARGVRIVGVRPQSPADEAHLVGGDRTTSDVILAVDGAPVGSPEALADAIHQHGVGEKVPLTVLSQGKYKTVTVALRAAPETRPAAANPAELPEAPPAPPARRTH